MAKQRLRSAGLFAARWRAWIQTGFLFVWLAPLGLRFHSFCGPVFHCYSCPLAAFACPIGIMAGAASLHMIPFALIGTLLVVGGLVGAAVCGWMCPFGFLQDLASRVPTRKFTLPAWSGHLRYVVLAGLVLAIPFFFGESHPLYICSVCPAGALEGSAPNLVKTAVAGGPVIWPNALKIGIVAAFLGAMFFVSRPWCTLLCPLGAIYGLFNRASVFFLRFLPEKCTNCGLCRKLCPMGVKPDERANDPRCMRCLECTRCEALTVGNAFEGGGDKREV